MYAIYDALFSEIPYGAQLTPFDLVALDTDLQEYLMDRSSCINMRWDQVAQISDSYSKWIKAAVAVQQQADAFNTLATVTEQRKYDALFAAVPKFNGTNKEDCAVRLSRITSLVATTG